MTMSPMDAPCPYCAYLGRFCPTHERPPMTQMQFDANPDRCPCCGSRLIDPDRNTIGKFRSDASDTQRRAALAAYPKTGTQRRRVLDEVAVVVAHGRTDDEIQRMLRMNPSTQRPRRRELVEGGWIEDSGRKRRVLASGEPAIVWVLTPKGRERYLRQGASR